MINKTHKIKTFAQFALMISAASYIPLIHAEGIPLGPATPAVPASVASNVKTSSSTKVGDASIIEKAVKMFGKAEANKPQAKKDTKPDVQEKVVEKKSKKQKIKPISQLRVRTGTNYIIPVAISHLNRIITPFEIPKIETSTSNSEAVISVKKNVIYITPNVSSPVTMFIKEGDDEDVAISLTLAPKKIPPVTTKVMLVNQKGNNGKYNSVAQKEYYEYKAPPEAKKWERSTDYENTLKNLLRTTASGYTPPGYKLRKIIRSIDENPQCSQTGISYGFSGGYMMQGHNYNVMIGRITNRTKKPLQVKENACANLNIAAVAAYPYTLLEPGQSSEIYIVLQRKKKASKNRSIRPSLL